MNGVALEGWPLVGVLLIVAMGALLLGAAFGYFSASRDLQEERAKAWRRGANDAATTPLGTLLRNPYRSRRDLAPEPPHVVIPNPPAGWRTPIDRQFEPFDQDAPTAAAVAIELRGDD